MVQDSSNADKPSSVLPALRLGSVLKNHNPLTRVTAGGVGNSSRRLRQNDLEGSQSTERRLIIGREITLSGEIKECAHLLVEGRVDAALKDAEYLTIAAGGSFRGPAEVNIADIKGRFEGQLTCQKLVIYAGGFVQGEIFYRDIEIHQGGILCGQVKQITS